MNIFEQASRFQFRFESIRGLLNIEQLWSVPLSSKDGFDLDCIAKTINGKLKEAAEESFVKVRSTSSTTNETRLEIVKHVIAAKLEELEANQNKIAKRQEREKLLELLDKKNNAKLEELSADDIKKRLAELEA